MLPRLRGIRMEHPACGIRCSIRRMRKETTSSRPPPACLFTPSQGSASGLSSASYVANAERGYHGILSQFIQTGPENDVSLTRTVKGAGLGGDPYRDGSYAYYIGEKVGTNDPKGMGAFLLASAEMENSGECEAGPRRHGSAGLHGSTARSGPTPSANRSPFITNGMTRATADTLCSATSSTTSARRLRHCISAHASGAAPGAGLHHRLSGYSGEESEAPLHAIGGRNANCGLGESRRRADDHGE